ncbi:mRNA-decapping enzyme 1A-like isoform X1 [Salvelinus fontinalis]|uniref:mRNA-decapping enzyme 1A-like isoform X1 n=1 Tax=Salvelinus fontinalis TaxID=8038 RepID=UPI00248563A0|nr:mRNA-decapping enzyme 1A-like isoform X1 [Salvelinus fontinalis]
METASKMSLAALQQQDPYINKLLDVTGQVALYTFNSKANEWEKTEIEGTLFVYARCASPHHGFTIMNRLSTENLVEPINKDLEFQLQDPFLLYRNANLGIYSIWFYDKKDCQRIAQLMVKIVKQEALQTHRGCPERADVPGRTNGCSIDILELLSKAKDEFHRTQAGKTEMSVTAEQRMNTETLKSAGDTTEHAHSASQPEQSSHSGQRQITVEELFGSSLPKEASLLPAMPTQSSTDPAATAPVSFHQAQRYAPPIPFQPLLTPCLTADPVRNNRHVTPGLISLMEARGGPGPGYALYPVFPGGPSGDPQPQHSVSPLLVTPSGVEACGPPPGPLSAYLGKEPAYLKPSPSDLHKPALAPSVLPSPLATPQSFREPITKPAALGSMPTGRVQLQSKEMDVFAQSQKLSKTQPAVPMKVGLVVPVAGTSLTGTKHSILLSPSAFQHSVAKTTELQRKAAPPSPPPAATGVVELPQPSYNKIQLQDTLIHLIKNDPVFLSAIHEAYLHSLSKDLSHVKL